jgi:aminoglycoside phosphotransferase (APT) family kinase protein
MPSSRTKRSSPAPNEAPGPAEIRAAVAPHLGRSHLEIQPIPTGRFNSCYYLSGEPGEFVLRIAPPREAGFLFYERRMMMQEPEIHELVRQGTSVPVPEVVAFDRSHRIIRRDFLILRRLGGRAASDQALPRQALGELHRQVGRALAQVHRIVRPRYGYLGAHRPMKPQESWRAAFEVMWNKLLDDLERCGGYTREEAALARRALERNLSAFGYSAPASLLHMDVWAQNILCDEEGRLTGLVDFDRALWGDPEIEFAVLDYCGISTPAFWEGYGRERPEGPEARLRWAFYYLYEVQKYVVIERLRRKNPERADGYKRQAFTLLSRAVQAGK